MLRNLLRTLPNKSLQVVTVRNAQKKYPKVDKKLQAAAESLAARGFLRPNKPWEPPANIGETIMKICADNGLNPNSEFEALEIKFKVLKQCFEETGHGVPNSLLHTIEGVYELREFYQTPVDTVTPFDALKRMDLPKNLHIQPDYVRYHPDNPMLGGTTPFPKSSTIVTGLKARKKYESIPAKRSWP